MNLYILFNLRVRGYPFPHGMPPSSNREELFLVFLSRQLFRSSDVLIGELASAK